MVAEEINIALEVVDLAVGYINKKSKTEVANAINFKIEKGELVGLVGANGVGKSTLLRTLASMQPKLKGEILFGGKKIEDFAPLELAQQLSIVLTEQPASKNLSVFELVSLGRQPHTNWLGSFSAEDKRAIEFAITSTEIENLQHKKCYELSDGQLQRVLIARALAQDTPIIFLDEPTTHLDLYHRAYVLKLLKKLANETQKTILFSTHEIDLAIQLTDKMIVMDKEAVFYESPCNLIEAKRFDILFPPETIEFDGKTGRFLIRS